MLYWNTVNDLLTDALKLVMNEPVFNEFRLVGGTALSLQLGHRMSIDIDLFTDVVYRSIDFNKIDDFFESRYEFVDSLKITPVGMGKSYRIGKDKDNAIKVDIYYTDKYIQEPLNVDGIRMATEAEILAMKAEVVQQTGRKKDFWDIIELMDTFNISQMLDLHKQRYPYSHDKNLILKNLVNFKMADLDTEPICLKGKHWELIKLDFVELLEAYHNQQK